MVFKRTIAAVATCFALNGAVVALPAAAQTDAAQAPQAQPANPSAQATPPATPPQTATPLDVYVVNPEDLLDYNKTIVVPTAYVTLLTEGHMDWVWGEAEKAGVPVYVLVPQPLVYLIDKVAQKYPGLKITMDHLSLSSSKKDAEAFHDLDMLLAIAERPNVAAKVSALPCYSTGKYPYKELHDYIRRAYDAFGPKRLFWGTDLSRSPITYRQHVTMFTEEIPWLTSEDKEWIMGRAVCEWLDWKI